MKAAKLILPTLWVFLPTLLLRGAHSPSAAELERQAYHEQQVGDLDGALKDYNRALELDPKRAGAYVNRGSIRKSKGDVDGALADYNRALELDPKFAAAYSNRGTVRKERGDLDGALEDYNRALKLDPKRAPAYFNRGLIRYGRGDLAGALDDYNRGIKRERNLPSAYFNRAKIEEAKGDRAAALADYSAALKLATNYAAAYSSRGGLRSAGGDLKGALTDYDRALQLDPGRVSVSFNRGLLRLDQGDLDGALADFRQCSARAKGELELYARIRVWLIRAGRGERPAADEELSDGLQNRRSAGIEWPLKVASFLLDRTNEDQLLSAAASPKPEEERGRKCEFWYYSGMKLLLAGEKQRAAAAFRQCLTTGERSFAEYRRARAELEKLGG